MLASFGDFPTDQISQFGGYGVVGAVAIILGTRVWQLEREKRLDWKTRDIERAAVAKTHEEERATWWNARLADWKELGTLVREQNVVQVQLTAARETGANATNAMAEASRLQAAVLDRLVDAVDRWIISTESLRETILTKVVKP